MNVIVVRAVMMAVLMFQLKKLNFKLQNFPLSWIYEKNSHHDSPNHTVQIFSISSALEIIELFFFSHKSIKFSSPLSNNKFRELKKLFSCPKILLCLFTLHSSHLFSIFLCCGDDRRILNYMLTTQSERSGCEWFSMCLEEWKAFVSFFCSSWRFSHCNIFQ